MGKGTRRLAPPLGYMTSTEAVKKLGRMLYKHVEAGRVRTITPPGYKISFYNRTDVESWAATEALYAPYERGMWKYRPSSKLERAREEDMPAIIEISQAIFGGDGSTVTPAEHRLTWLRKNRETFHVLRNQQGVIVGYSSLLPLKREIIDHFIRDEIGLQEITADDILVYEPDTSVHLYLMSIGVDPQYSTREKHVYGARLVSGLLSFFFSLAERGIEIKTLTARSQTRDGINLLRKMSIPQLRSPVPGKNLFSVDVAASGFPAFVHYCDLLEQWRAIHAPAQPSTHPEKRRKPAVIPDRL